MPDRISVERQLQKITSHPLFVRSERLVAFLNYTVREYLDGRADSLKEYVIGTEVYGRKPPYDPRVDSLVRVEARRLRLQLQRYYEQEGQVDEVVISYPKGSYVPQIEHKPVQRTLKSACPVVGRERDLDELEEAWERARLGSIQLVFLCGEPGIGKTRLVDLFQETLPAESAFLRGQCYEASAGSEAYYPMLEALGKLVHSPHRGKFRETLDLHAPTWLLQYPALLEPEETQALQRETAGSTPYRMVRELGDALESLSLAIPLIIVLEDLHWADAPTVDLLASLVLSRRPLRLLVVGTFRNIEEYAADSPLRRLQRELASHPFCRELVLAPLTAQQVGLYLLSQDQDLIARLHHRSHGNPLFLLELLRAPRDATLPENLRRIIEARIDRIPPALLPILETASCVGDTFPVSVLALEEDEDTVEDLLSDCSLLIPAATRAYPNGELSPAYSFAHALYREVLQTRQSTGQRARRHKRIARWQERAWGDRVAEVAAELAEHFELALEPQRAASYLLLATDTLIGRAAHLEAANTLEHGLTLLGEDAFPELRIQLLSKLCDTLAISLTSLALPALNRLVESAKTLGMWKAALLGLVKKVFLLSSQDRSLSLQSLKEARDLSRHLSEPGELAAVTTACTFFEFSASSWSGEAAALAKHNHALFLDSINNETLAGYYVYYSYILFSLSEYRESVANARRGRDLMLKRVNPYLFLEFRLSHSMVPWSLIFLGEWGQALEELAENRKRTLANGDPVRTRLMSLYESYLRLFAGDLDAVNQAYREALIASAPGEVFLRAWHAVGGLALVRLHRWEEAEVAFRAGQQSLEDVEGGFFFDWHWALLIAFGMAEMALLRNQLESARERANHLSGLADETAEKTWRALTWELAARIESAAGRPGDEMLDKALRELEGWDIPLAVGPVHATAARLRGGEHITQSRAAFKRLADSLPEEHPLRALIYVESSAELPT